MEGCKGYNKKDGINSKAKGRALDISKDGKYLAIGTFGGLLRIFENVKDAVNWKEVTATEITGKTMGMTH